MVKDSLVEQIMATAVEMADAGRLLAAASGRNECRPRGEDETDDCTSTSVLRAVLAGDGDGGARALARVHRLALAAGVALRAARPRAASRGGSCGRGRSCN